MVAVELFEADGQTPAAELTARIVAKARDKGLVLLSCGTYYNVLRILVPLTVSDADLERGLAIIGECFDELA
ncbi:5-aminovalerate aminotransferase DavT [compost metagenome]